jgi:hypothetical protein
VWEFVPIQLASRLSIFAGKYLSIAKIKKGFAFYFQRSGDTREVQTWDRTNKRNNASGRLPV